MKYVISLWVIALCFVPVTNYAQNINNESLQNNTEENNLPPKVLHAEPLYIDLIRDLGARKGEKEWNIGLGLTDNNNYDEYIALIEYEWAPIDRLGFEIELPFSLYYRTTAESAPANKLNSLKMATQYSFFVSEKWQTSMAIGYIHEFELTEFNNYNEGKLVTGNIYNPFFVAAKNWGKGIHSLLYTGPQFFHHFNESQIEMEWEINSNFHYMIPDTRNFVGLEFNKRLSDDDFDMIIRPQMRVDFAENLLVGIVTGIPLSKRNERFSAFLRLIYEPAN
ncbi:hypothetical protein GCM10007424_05010 [Flavobacterium suaedae]|uniref:Phosphoribosylformylglycinamidine synthase n=1 Tax=Flavobacterium suaedae TaxID=1767027 RepID=A0ABQ1JG04_9FLAO|nr:HAEPLYID family protein [Flavobacterium suaedae]GGB68024.1 hypothetical protein GCM10007424_05010 [Flavobacterium suaedae]